MKRICFLVDSIFTVGGVQRVTAVIAKQLAKDFDVSVVTFDRQEEADVSLSMDLVTQLSTSASSPTLV